jgi:Helix-hairpin-helix containing domain
LEERAAQMLRNGTARAVRIFKTYGAEAIQVMTENPYRLARDIRGSCKTSRAIVRRRAKCQGNWPDQFLDHRAGCPRCW